MSLDNAELVSAQRALEKKGHMSLDNAELVSALRALEKKVDALGDVVIAMASAMDELSDALLDEDGGDDDEEDEDDDEGEDDAESLLEEVARAALEKAGRGVARRARSPRRKR